MGQQRSSEQLSAAPTGGGGYATVEDEGTPLTQRTTINFTGAGVSAADSGGKTVVTIAGGGSPAATTVEVNLGATAKWYGRFTITDAAIGASSKVLCWQAPGPYTGKGTRADEAAMQQVQVIAVNPASGSATVYWQTPPMVVECFTVTRAPNFGNGTAANSGTNRDFQCTALRLGKVRGNVKFSYIIFS